jgi:predicted ferric reductase
MQLARLWYVFIAIIVGLTLLWLLSLEPGAVTGDFWMTRKTLVLGTGVLAFGLMSVGIFLAVRPVWFETPLGGLDKFYRLHKWLGIAAFAFAAAHWALRMGPSWITYFDLFELPARPPRSADAAGGFDIFRYLKHPATRIGEWTFYVLALLVALALWKRFPYKYFFKTHKLMPAVYLLLVFHTLILVDQSYWSKPIGPALALLLIFGTGAAFVALFQKIGYRRRASGKITRINLHDDKDVLDVCIQLDGAWRGHDAGQFAFVNFDDPEAAHPFTISSAWQNDGQLMLTIKALGDYTRTLAESLHIGQGVDVEGPYGRFNFQGNRSRQIWIGGGVGITPFIAALQARIKDNPRSTVDLFYATRTADPAFTASIRELAEQTGVRFHALEDKDGLLTFDHMEALIPEWRQADVWFCGPGGLADALRNPMIARGLPASQFHQELFEMR